MEDEAPTPLEPGVRIGSYVVERELGAGAMATVLQVRHAYLDTVHALKLVPIQHDTLRERLWFEGQVQSAIVHPNVVQIREMLVHDRCPVLILEYVEGCTLADLLAAGPLDPTVADVMARDIIDGVRAAHTAGIVHRDLKPDNILLADSADRWIAKVGDFGIARRIESATGMTLAGFPLGTPRYMAPEQYRDARAADLRADVFSIGCILYEMLSGRVAFPHDDLEVLRDAIDAGTIVPLSTLRPELPRRMIETVERCLSARADDRPADCDELLALWSGRPSATLGSSEGTLAVIPRSPRRRRWRGLLPLGALVAAGVSALGLLAVAAIVVSSTWTADRTLAPVPVIEVHAPAPVIEVVAPAPIIEEPPIEAPKVRGRTTGTVTQAGADWVLLVGPSGAVPAGQVPAGKYAVRAGFDGRPPIPAGVVTVEPGARVHLRCHPKFVRCVVEP